MGISLIKILSGAIFLNLVAVCNGGITSPYVRRADRSIDMPFDSDVFRPPEGYNAPQQVNFILSSFPSCKYIQLTSSKAYLVHQPNPPGSLEFGCPAFILPVTLFKANNYFDYATR